MAELFRITTYPGTKAVYRSSITGKFVSKSHYLDNPDTTYKSTVRTPRYEWIDVDELLQGFREIQFYQFYDSTDSSLVISLQKPIRVTELSKVCDQVGVSFNSIIKTLHDFPYRRDVLWVDVHEFKKQGR